MSLINSLFEPNIIKLEKRKDIDGLIKALNYPYNIEIRISAIKALGRIKDTSADRAPG